MSRNPILAGELAGQRVYIEWVNPDGDWHWFRLLAVDGAWLKVQGVRHPDGTQYGSGPMWVPAAAIAHIEAEP